MTTAERNRAIKKVLAGMFGKGVVTVKGGRGTSWGWIRVNIAYQPLDQNERQALQKKIWDAFRAHGRLDSQIGSYDSADYGSGREIHIQFERPRYRMTLLHDDGTRSGLGWDTDQWEAVEKPRVRVKAVYGEHVNDSRPT